MEFGNLPSLEARLARLELQNRRLRWLALCLPLLAVLLGAKLADAPPVTLEAQELILKDSNGKVAFVLDANGFKGDVQRGMMIIDRNNQSRIAFGVNNDNLLFINTFDRAGKRVDALGEEK